MLRPFRNLIQHIFTHIIHYKHRNILSSVINTNIRVNERERERERERVYKQHVSYSVFYDDIPYHILLLMIEAHKRK